MNSQPDRLEQFYALAPLSEESVPLRCPRPMPIQQLTCWTPLTIVGALLGTLLSLPRFLFLPAVLLLNRSRRA